MAEIYCLNGIGLMTRILAKMEDGLAESTSQADGKKTNAALGK
jgi:hypothetical protein